MNNELGCFYKTVRLYQVITKKEICIKAKISRQYLTRIEDSTDYFNISRSMNARMQKALRIDFINDPELLREFYELKDHFIEYLINWQDKEAQAVYQKIMDQLPFFQNMICFPEIILLKFVYHVVFEPNDPEMEQLLDILKRIADHFPFQLLQLYNLYLGIYEMDKGKLDMAYEYLIKAHQIFNNESMQSMIVFSMAELELKKNNSLEALRYTMKARELFDETCNYRRSIQCISRLALVWTHLREFDGAAALCDEAIRTCRMLDFPAVLGSCYMTLALISLHKGEYSNVIDLVQKANYYGERDPMLFFYAAFAGWKMQDIDAAARWIGLANLQRRADPSTGTRLLRQMKRMTGNCHDWEGVLLKMVDIVSHSKVVDNDLLRIFYAELAALYKHCDQYEPALDYYERYQQM